VTTTPAPEVAAPSKPADPRDRRILAGVFGGLRPGFLISLLGIGAAVLGIVVQISATTYVAESVLASEPVQRAACAVGAGDDLWCAWAEADLSEIPAQQSVTPVNSKQICADFVRLGDPQDRSVTTVPCSFLFKVGAGSGAPDRADRRAGFLYFQGAASRPEDLDAFASNLGEFADLADVDSDALPIGGKVISRPRPDVLVFAYATSGLLEGEQSFIVSCGTFDLRGSLNTRADVTDVALSLADRWCPATEQPTPGGLED
jgi:hypothetical protein